MFSESTILSTMKESLAKSVFYKSQRRDWQIFNHKYSKLFSKWKMKMKFSSIKITVPTGIVCCPFYINLTEMQFEETEMEFNCKFCLYLINKTPCFIVPKWSSLYSGKVLILPIIIYHSYLYVTLFSSPGHGASVVLVNFKSSIKFTRFWQLLSGIPFTLQQLMSNSKKLPASHHIIAVWSTLIGRGMSRLGSLMP